MLREDGRQTTDRQAAEALGNIGSEEVVEGLKKALKDEGEWAGRKVKDAAFAALERISRRSGKRIYS